MQRESLLRQPTTAPTRLGSGKQRKPFSPTAARSPEGKAGRGCPGSQGPAALLGVSGARNTLPTGSPWWGSRIGHAIAFYAQAAAMPPEPARAHSAEAPSHRRPKTSFWQLHSAKGKSLPAAINSPNAPRLRKAKQAVFAPRPQLSRGHSGAGLPLPPWALVLCWGSPMPETHSPRILLGGKVELGVRRPSRPRPQPCSLSQLGR